jgi:hypothetical protein
MTRLMAEAEALEPLELLMEVAVSSLHKRLVCHVADLAG